MTLEAFIELDILTLCGKGAVKAKGFGQGGGVECTNPNCDFWDCF